MKIEPKFITRTQPREFWQYGKLTLEPGDVIYYCSDNMPCTVGVLEAGTHSAKRAVRKDGKPLGPWITVRIPHRPYAFYVKED